ncbi:type IX secretion system membrane protein PorP/SprF [Persicobacter psychrovividus]|uniref:Membrane protein n=1 Tax=Persicobacter psychrovividus TaxID=387638 RepID=A0ABM7VLM4_9BACT|nr:membrane protein [Persicobacter psychrovividus]
MKSYIKYSLLFFVLAGSNAFGQSAMQMSQYMVNYIVINPAVVGLDEHTAFRLAYRNQWAGIDGAPSTYFGSVNSSIGHQGAKGSSSARRRGYRRAHNSQTAPHHGVGGYVLNDQIGAINQVRMYGNYAYHLSLNSSIRLAAGGAIGLISNQIDKEKIHVGDQNDPILANAQNSLHPDLQLGFWLHSSNWFAGISATEFNLSNGFGTELGSLRPNYLLTGGYRIQLSRELDFVPSVLMKTVSFDEFQYDINLKMRYKSVLWGGLSLRGLEDVSMIFGMDLLNGLMFAYSYDYQINGIQTVSSGSHEITAGFNLRGKRQRRGLNRRSFW